MEWGLQVLVAAYCNNLSTISNTAQGAEDMFHKIVQFSKWARLQVSPSKSTYTCAQASSRAHLTVLVVTNSLPISQAITELPPNDSYKYMGLLINLALDWSAHLKYTKAKVAHFQHLIWHKHLSTKQHILVSNVVINTYIGYGMCVVPYPMAWLCEVQKTITNTLKASMNIPTNMDNEPFFMPKANGC
jgi:hypothetical protein